MKLTLPSQKVHGRDKVGGIPGETCGVAGGEINALTDAVGAFGESIASKADAGVGAVGGLAETSGDTGLGLVAR
jgi:hypothetical protein